MIVFVILYAIWISPINHAAEIPDDVITEMVYKVNKVRTSGCRCGRRYMPPVGKVEWNETLYRSALSHARDMWENNFFEHFSSKGLNIGERLDAFGYYWQHAGENLGEGQRSFDEVLFDWIESPIHCRMLMNPDVKEMGIAKYKKYWVQHFGSQIPAGSVRVEK